MEPVTLDELCLATGGTLASPADRRSTFVGVSLDSRTIRPGELFWALRGQRHDGHDFIGQALSRGAVAVVGSEARHDLRGPVVHVDDPVAALGRLASWYRLLFDAFVVGVTGSVGKTTTRELIHAALGGETRAIRSHGNQNNQLGVPLTLLQIERRHAAAIIEMGADRPGEIESLARMARPEIGVITALGVAHIETFGSEEAILNAKGELLDQLPASGLAVLPGDHEKGRTLARRFGGSVALVGTAFDNTHRVMIRDVAPNRLRFSVDGSPFEVMANGRHFAVPAGMAVVVARQLGRTDQQIASGLRAFEPVAGRCRIAMSSPWTVVDDTYNANPDSMRAGLDALAAWPAAGRRVFVCGDMYGLGARSAASHVDLGKAVAIRGIELMVAIGDFASQVAHGARRSGMEARRLAIFSDRQEAAQWLRTALRPDDVVWVKASRPVELERLVAELVESAAGSEPLRKAA